MDNLIDPAIDLSTNVSALDSTYKGKLLGALAGTTVPTWGTNKLREMGGTWRAKYASVLGGSPIYVQFLPVLYNLNAASQLSCLDYWTKVTNNTYTWQFYNIYNSTLQFTCTQNCNFFKK